MRCRRAASADSASARWKGVATRHLRVGTACRHNPRRDFRVGSRVCPFWTTMWPNRHRFQPDVSIISGRSRLVMGSSAAQAREDRGRTGPGRGSRPVPPRSVPGDAGGGTRGRRVVRGSGGVPTNPKQLGSRRRWSCSKAAQDQQRRLGRSPHFPRRPDPNRHEDTRASGVTGPASRRQPTLRKCLCVPPPPPPDVSPVTVIRQSCALR